MMIGAPKMSNVPVVKKNSAIRLRLPVVSVLMDVTKKGGISSKKRTNNLKYSSAKKEKRLMQG